MWLMLLNDNNSKKELDLWRWKFVGEKEVSRTFSIKFSESSPKHWIIETSKLDNNPQIKALKRACEKACKADFITIECDFEDEERIKSNCGILMYYIVNFEAITCVSEGREIFTVRGRANIEREWEVRIDN